MQTNKIKVLLHYIVYPMALATYFKKALEHREDVDLKVAGPYTGAWMPWTDAQHPSGMMLPKKYDITPDIPIPFAPNVGEYNYEIVQSQLGDWHPDLIIQIDAGLHFKYKPNEGMVVTVGTDPHVLNDWYDVPRKYSDKFFSMQQVYAKSGDIYLPYAYSQYDHYPDDIINPDDAVDAVLVGNIYAQRVEWVDRLRKLGIRVEHQLGVVFDEARALYNRGRIGLNWSTLDDLNARAFEIPAMKLAPVMNYVTDLHRFLTPNFHYLEFSNMEDAIAQVLWFKTHPEDCRVYAERAYNAIQGETYDARVDQILKECGFVS